MADPSQLESFLKEQLSEASLDSSGRFTLAREEALAKLSQFQLPDPNWWVLKIVQGVVASGAEHLIVRQTATDTEFLFSPKEHWTVWDVEEAIFDPETSPLRGLDHLKRGLWSAALNQGRPFHLELQGSTESLVWTVNGTQRIPGTSARTALTVSHRTLAQGKGLPILRNIEAARHNAAILLMLRERANLCPIPLLVDKRRIDALQVHPTFGHTRRSFPFVVAVGEGDGPPMGIPPGTWAGFQIEETAAPQPPLLTALENRRQVAGPSAALLTFHLEHVKKGKSHVWEARQAPSVFHWVLDGVVIGLDALPLLERSVSAAVFAPADGLKLDITGFGVVRTDQSELRLYAACKSLDAAIASSELSLAKFVGEAKSTARLSAIALGAGGALFLLLSPIHGLGMLGFAAFAVWTGAATELALEAALQHDLTRMQEEWQDMRPPRPIAERRQY